MKKTTAVIGTLAMACSLMSASSAMADTSTTTVDATAPRLADKLIASYWGYYAGPALSNITDRATLTNDTGDLDDVQGLDSTVTLGYRLTKDISMTANYRSIYTPVMPDGSADYLNKDGWIAVRNGKILNNGQGLNLAADIRAYVPIQTSGRMNTAFRSTQTLTYDIPKTRLTLGTFTIARVNLLHGEHGAKNVDNMNLSLSTLLNYQMTPTLALTGWSDILTYDIKFDKDVYNKLVPISVGMNWDINPKISVNPQLTAFPGAARLNNVTLGGILSARFL
jgi:hypothetical protein